MPSSSPCRACSRAGPACRRNTQNVRLVPRIQRAGVARRVVGSGGLRLSGRSYLQDDLSIDPKTSPRLLLERSAKIFFVLGGHRPCRALARSRSHSTTKSRILRHASRRLVPADSAHYLEHRLRGGYQELCRGQWQVASPPMLIQIASTSFQNLSRPALRALAVGCGRCAAMAASMTLTSLTMAASEGIIRRYRSTRGPIERYRAPSAVLMDASALLNLTGSALVSFRNAISCLIPALRSGVWLSRVQRKM